MSLSGKLPEIEPSIPELHRGPVSRQTLVEWCAAENDYYPLHYDERVARDMGLPGTPIQGTWQFALMSRMVERWLTEDDRLLDISVRYRTLALEGETVVARGKIRERSPHEKGLRIHIDIWIERSDGEKSAVGEAIVVTTLT